MRFEKIQKALSIAVCFTIASPVMAASQFISSATLGYYNSSLGDLGSPSGVLPWFPAPFTFGGTQDEIFTNAPDLSGASVALGNWLGDPGNLNGNWSGPQAIPANWTVNNEVAAIYAFDAGPGMSDLTASFGLIDNGIHIWVDGIWKVGARDPEGRAWTNIALGDVGPGQHYLQILLEDSGGSTWYFNPAISGTVVPVPAAVWLFGSGLLGLIGIARRGSKSRG